jgi:E3 ubiquitin-protein ligase HECTD1
VQQSTILREVLSGFVFDSNRGTRVNISADNPLGSQFQFGWNGKKGKKYKTKAEMAQQKVTAMAAELQTKYFSANQESTRRVAAELRAILSSVETACQVHESDAVRDLMPSWLGVPRLSLVYTYHN